MEYNIRINDFPLEKLTHTIIGVGIEIHKSLGKGFSEIVYKDALEYELVKKNIQFEREKEYNVQYKETTLKHKYFADFVIQNLVILEVKSKASLGEADYAQTINYLKCSGCKVGMILNFGLNKLGIKRIIY